MTAAAWLLVTRILCPEAPNWTTATGCLLTRLPAYRGCGDAIHFMAVAHEFPLFTSLITSAVG